MTMKHLLRAEWTKLWSVRRWMIGLFVTAVVTVLFALLSSSGSGTDINDHPQLLGPVGPAGDRVYDEQHLVYQPLVGDGSITARVTSQADSNEWARAGVTLRARTGAGSPYVSVLVTPDHGVRFHTNYATDLAGGGGTAPRWLRLSRTGSVVTGYESADGVSWNEVGSVTLADLPEAAVAGLFVNSPNDTELERGFGYTSISGAPSLGTATFDNVVVDPPAPAAAAWQDLDTAPGAIPPGDYTEQDGVITVTGSGDLGVRRFSADPTQLGLFGIFAGQIAVVAIAVLFITAEFKRGMIRTTFAASPRRGRVLAAKAIVIGSVMFVVGLVANLISFVMTQPILRSNGFEPPGVPLASLSDLPVLRAIAGASLFLALIGVLALAVGTILRRSAGAIAGLLMLLLLPFIVQGALPLTAANWLVRSTPLAGLALLQTSEPDAIIRSTDPMNMASPLAGLAVLAAYAAAALGLAYWRLQRRDA